MKMNSKLRLCISILLSSACNLLLAEPMCSKFDYEEKLLGKLIKMEIKFEKMIEDMTDLKNNVKSDIENMNTKIEQQTADMLELHHSFTSLKSSVGNLHEKTQNVTNQMNEVEETIGDLLPNITKLVMDDLKCSPGPSLAAELVVGARVVRGKDWKWGTQDGYGGGIILSSTSRNRNVKWDHDGSANGYRVDVEMNVFDITLAECN